MNFNNSCFIRSPFKKLNIKLVVYFLVAIITFNSVIMCNNIPQSLNIDNVQEVEAATIGGAIIAGVVSMCLYNLGVYAGKKIVEYIELQTEKQLLADNWVVPEIMPIEANDYFWEDPKTKEVTFTPAFQDIVINNFNEIASQQGYFYTYTVDPLLPESFSSYDYYTQYINTIKENVICFQGGAANGSAELYKAPDDYFLIYNTTDSNICNSYLYNSNWQNLSGYRLERFEHGPFGPSAGFNIQFYSQFKTVYDSEIMISQYQPFTLVSIVPHQIITFRTLDDFKNWTGGIMPYYTSDKYDPDYIPTSNITYNTTDNSLTYGDIVDYVTTNNITNHNEVYNYINNYTPTGGGGSGDSGGGNGGINLDWLGSLGTLLGSILNGLGQLINNLLTSIIDTVTSIVDNLNTLISGIGNIIPESFTLLINAVFGWLPDELRALIIGSVTLMILVGIIKLIRG